MRSKYSSTLFPLTSASSCNEALMNNSLAVASMGGAREVCRGVFNTRSVTGCSAELSSKASSSAMQVCRAFFMEFLLMGHRGELGKSIRIPALSVVESSMLPSSSGNDRDLLFFSEVMILDISSALWMHMCCSPSIKLHKISRRASSFFQSHSSAGDCKTFFTCGGS